MALRLSSAWSSRVSTQFSKNRLESLMPLFCASKAWSTAVLYPWRVSLFSRSEDSLSRRASLSSTADLLSRPYDTRSSVQDLRSSGRHPLSQCSLRRQDYIPTVLDGDLCRLLAYGHGRDRGHRGRWHRTRGRACRHAGTRGRGE